MEPNNRPAELNWRQPFAVQTESGDMGMSSRILYPSGQADVIQNVLSPSAFLHRGARSQVNGLVGLQDPSIILHADIDNYPACMHKG